jgi:hypothetical protein
LSSKLSKCSENIVKKTLKVFGRKIKKPLEFTPTIKKMSIEPFIELVSK